MDDAWKNVFDSKARRETEDYKRSYWTKAGFEELLSLTLKFVNELDAPNDALGNSPALSKKIVSILDVGCGPGVYCDRLAKKGYTVTGIDYSEEMIRIAKEKYQNIPNINFQVGNGYDLKFPDSSFDLVISIGALQCLLDHEKFLNELSRVASKHLILSTLWRDDTGEDPKIILEKQLKEDSWPTRCYHPSEIIPILESRGFTCRVIRENNGKEIRDGFFIIATRN